MKKKFFAVMLAASMAAALVGCGKSSGSNTSDTSNKEITAEKYSDTIKSNAAVYKNCITLPEYAGTEVEVDKSILEVTDEDIEDYIQSVLESYAETEKVTEGITKKDDVVTLDYSGKLDGVAFSGGTATDATYTIGSEKFISDLDKGLVGLTVGVEYDIPCTFPTSYSSSDLAGKNVIFTVKVTAINNTVVPELTDEWVAANAENLGIEEKTAAGLRERTKTYLEENAKISYSADKYSSLYSKIFEDIEVKEYPQAEMDSLKATLNTNVKSDYENYSSYYESLGISSYEAYLKQYYDCESEEEFDKYATENAQTYLKEKMIITIIAADNNITVSADEIKEMGKTLAESYGYDSYDDILEEYGNAMNAEVGYELLYEKVVDFLNEKVVEVEKTK